MRLASVRARSAVLLVIASFALAACREQPTAPVPILRIRNDTGDTLVYRVTELERAKREIFLGFVDTAGGIRTYSRAPGSVDSNSTENIWGYFAGAAIRIDLYRVTGTRLASAGLLDVTHDELLRSNYSVAVPPSAITK